MRKGTPVSVTFINRYADPEITAAGDNQKGATGGRLPEPLEVTVKDGSGSSGKAIPGGVAVGFRLGTGRDWWYVHTCRRHHRVHRYCY